MKNIRIPVRRNSKEFLLLLNAILCFCYAMGYLFLAVLPAISNSLQKNIHSSAIVSLNVLFLLILTLNLNTISVLYMHIKKADNNRIRIVYRVTFIVWSAYILTSYFFILYIPGFIQHFHHSISFSFRPVKWPTFILALCFAVGLSTLFTEYYKQAKMQHLLVFIIPAVLQFSFKLMLPFLFFAMSWLFFGGCQLLLYFSIIDSKRFSPGIKNRFIVSNYANQ